MVSRVVLGLRGAGHLQAVIHSLGIDIGELHHGTWPGHAPTRQCNLCTLGIVSWDKQLPLGIDSL